MRLGVTGSIQFDSSRCTASHCTSSEPGLGLGIVAMIACQDLCLQVSLSPMSIVDLHDAVRGKCFEIHGHVVVVVVKREVR
jgi:hypothetical protein